jgi:[ribosomal protein S5]-alanine N-acetyltransferase
MLLDGLETERLKFRALTNDDIRAWSRFLEDPNNVRYFPEVEFDSSERAEFWINKQLDRYRENRFGLHALILKETGEFVGQAGLLTQVIDDEDYIEIGYHLFPEHQGRGYATEAVIFCKEFAITKKYGDRLISIIHQDNTPSQKVAERNGMTPWKETLFLELPVVVYSIEINSQKSSSWT